MKLNEGRGPGRLAAICAAAFVLLPACSGCYPAAPPTAVAPDEADRTGWFEDVTLAAGLDFVHDPGPTGDYFMPQSMGSGCALFDCDGDGLLDIYLLQMGGPNSPSVNRLYRQDPPGHFRDITAGSGLDVAGHNCGVAIGDVNNDGRPDVLVTQYGGVKLFRNDGNGHFTDITAGSGLANPAWGMSAAFVDYDRDGWLDLVVVNYVDYDRTRECHSPDGKRSYCGPKHFPGTASRLFHNRGPVQEGGRPVGVRFQDVSLDSGVARLKGPGLGVVCADLDGDGWPDIFVANDGAPNRLWINRHDGTFVNEAASRGVAYTMMGQAYAGMGVALGDVDNNGLLDLYVTHLGTETHTLWKQGPRGLFRDDTTATGLAHPQGHGTGFGTLLADFNNDGALDLVVVNGRVLRGELAPDASLGFWQPYAERNQLWTNDGSGKFRDISASNPALCGYWGVGRGVACGDFDNDGAPDLLISSIGGRARLLRNTAPARGHWLKVRVLDPKLRRDAYGAEVHVRTTSREQLRLVSAADSYLSGSSPLLHVGLGSAVQFESLLVTWPDGTREQFPGGAADRLIEIRKGEGRSP
jgi:hypothetical protein